MDAVRAEGNVLITACPGSGKTRVITHKIAYELGNLRQKKFVISLTYTNRAADEIKSRIAEFDIDTFRLWSGTIHSFCLEWIIKPYIGYSPQLKNGFSIVDEFESEDLISELKNRFSIPRFDNIKKVYNLKGGFITTSITHIPLIEEYKKILHESKRIDFDDILYLAYRLLLDYPIIAGRLSNIFELICVDEYQDTQELQYAILAEIVKANKNKTRIFFVGDVCQAIYGSIGGVAKSLEEIACMFGHIHIAPMELSGNYRSNQRLINYYSHYQINSISIEAVSKIALNHGIVAYDTQTHKDEIHVVISEIIKVCINNGIPAHDICVMAPRWGMIVPMGRKLKSALPNVDFDAFGLSPFRKVRENIWFKILRLFLSSPVNTKYFLRYQWVNDLLIAIDEIIPDFLADVRNRKRYLLRVINSFQSAEVDSYKYIEEAILFFLNHLSIDLESYQILKTKKENFLSITELELQRDDFDYATDISILKRVFNSRNGVVISTCHAVKGEEYETVIAFGLLDGYIPNWKDEDKNAATKLMYVICSRAKNNLYLISERGHSTSLGPRVPTGILATVQFSYDA